MLSMLSLMMMDMKGMARMTNDEASAFLGGSVYYMYSVYCIVYSGRECERSILSCLSASKRC